jgi:hypothetical protein
VGGRGLHVDDNMCKANCDSIHDCGDGAEIECVNVGRIHDENKPVTARCFNKALKMEGACVGDGVERLKLCVGWRLVRKGCDAGSW